MDTNKYKMGAGEIAPYQQDDNKNIEIETSQRTIDNLDIESKIIQVRGQQVMLDRDLAFMYGVPTKALNQAVKRNMDRFPEDFMFQLSEEECSRSHFVTLNVKRGQNIKYLPYAFTENGVAMLSSVLRSKIAIAVNIQIMRIFTAMHHNSPSILPLHSRLELVERHQLELSLRQSECEEKIVEIFRRFENTSMPPVQGVFCDGQIFDAYTFASDLIRTARKRIILIDNYVDDSVLKMFTKRGEGVSATIVTKRISDALKVDIERHDHQYPPVEVRTSDRFHDRFLILDDTVYHLGASLKDLGKKLFAFSRMEVTAEWLLGVGH